MAQMGMDVEAVENVGRQLKQSASSVDAIVSTLDKTVSGLSSHWEGPDAQRFAQSWPTFRKSLLAAQASVAGLGQSALNNASEQREASGAKGGTSAPFSPPAHVGDAGGSGAPGSPESGSPGSAHGALQPGDVNAYRQYEESSKKYWYTDKTTGEVVYTDGHGMGKDNCTAWVDWRREQLGLPVGHGAGKDLAGNLSGTPTTPPTLGAAVSYIPADSPKDGHVMLVEQVYDTNPPSFRVSEDNFANNYKDTRVWTQQPDGLWQVDGRGPHYELTISPGKN